MKRILLPLLLALSSLAAAHATDFGQMTADTEYAAPGMEEVQGYYVATTSGTLTVTSINSTSYILYPYSDAEHEWQMNYTFKPNYAAQQCYYTLEVNEGQTVYLYNRLPFGPFTTVLTLTTADQVVPIELSAISPKEGEEFNVALEGGQMTLYFNRDIRMDYTATVAWNGQTRTAEAIVSGANAMMCHADLTDAIDAFIEQGAQKGETFTVTLTGIRDAAKETNLYNGDGTLIVSYLFGGRQPRLSGDGIQGRPFLSYFMNSGTDGIFTLTFDQELDPILDPDQQNAYIDCGSRTSGTIEEGTYYREYIPYTVDGCTVTIDMRGKLRTSTSMVPAYGKVTSIYLKVMGIKGLNGQYAKTEAGFIGSFNWDLSFTELDNNILSEWTPASGAAVRSGDQVELWLHNEGAIVQRAIVAQVGDEQVDCSYTVSNDPDDAQAQIYTITVPAIAQSGEMTLSFDGLESADGRTDHWLPNFTSRFQYEYVPSAISKLTTSQTHDLTPYNVVGQRQQQARGLVIRDGRISFVAE